MSRGRRTDRIAYVMKEWDLPVPLPSDEWQLDASFNAGDEILRDPELATVYKAALEKGAELVTAEGQHHRRADLHSVSDLPRGEISLARSLGLLNTSPGESHIRDIAHPTIYIPLRFRQSV